MTDEYEGRILAALEGRENTDGIPKVPHAGGIVTEDGMRWQRMHTGVQVLADGYYGAWMTRLIRALEGHHEPQEELVFHELLPYLGKAPVMMELGSYWAYYSIWLQHEYPDARLYLVEPDPRHLAVGMLNLCRNLTPATVIPALIGRSPCDPELAEMPAVIPYKERQQVVVPTYSVDRLCALLKLDHIDLLHADIQAAEMEMLLGARLALSLRWIDFLLLSTHSDEIHALCRAYLAHQGYRIVIEHTPAESFSADGLIFAVSPQVKVFPIPTITRRGAV